jgi:hypothetical protein
MVCVAQGSFSNVIHPAQDHKPIRLRDGCGGAVLPLLLVG